MRNVIALGLGVGVGLSLVIYFISPWFLLGISKICNVDVVYIVAKKEGATITTSQWDLQEHDRFGSVHYQAKVRALNEKGNETLNVTVNQIILFKHTLSGDALRVQTQSTSRLSGDDITSAEAKKYVYPGLEQGHVSIIYLFRSREGRTMTGLFARPRFICNTKNF